MAPAQKRLIEDEEQLCAQDQSDSGADIAEAPSTGFRARFSVAVLGFAGVAGFVAFCLQGQSGLARADEAHGGDVIDAWAARPAPAYHAPWLAKPRMALDTPRGQSESVGVTAMNSKAEALENEAKGEVDASKYLDKVADHYRQFAKILRDQADSRHSLVAALGEKAQVIAANAAKNISSSKVLNHTAQLQAQTANMIQKQAEDSISNAQEMEKTAHGVQAVDDLVRKQKQIAEASKGQAAAQMHAAKEMMLRAAGIMDEAHEDVAAADAIKTEGGKEMAVVRNVMNVAKGMDQRAANATQAAKAMAQKGLASKKAAQIARLDANSTLMNYKNALAEITRAGKEITEAIREREVANQSVASATAMNQTALSRKKAAESVLKALRAQQKPVDALADAADGMKDKAVIEDLAESQMQKMQAGIKAASAEVASAMKLAQKAKAKKDQAEKHKADSEAMRKSAQHHKETATAKKEHIDSEAQVFKAGEDEVQALKRRGEEESLAKKAMENAKHVLKAAVEAEKHTASKEISGASAMVAGVPRTTAVGAAAMEDASKKVVAVAEMLSKEMGQVKAADPQAIATESDKSLTAAIAREDTMLKDAAERRICVHLPGVELQKAGQEGDFSRIVGNDRATTHKECAAKCQKHAGCKQATFSWVAGCHLLTGSTYEVSDFSDDVNSSYCGEVGEKKALLDMIHKAYAQKPYIPPSVNCSWVDEDCSHTKCCNNFKCNGDFSQCGGYSCYKKDATYASCHYKGAPDGWDGYKLGGPRELREIPKAQTPWLLQGTSLFCFSAVMWNKPAAKVYYDSEADLANNWKTRGLGITQCDESLILEGEDAPLSESKSVLNVDAFIHTWEKVRQDGRYKNHDWVVKVDVDTVFFPDRLKMHLDQLRTPKGAKVYLQNNDWRFHFVGAMEVLTVEALDFYYTHADTCSRKQGHEGGEDFYMKTCLDGIGVDHQTDFKLLRDKYAAQEGCDDGWVTAFHFYKAVDAWNDCHEQAISAR